MARHANHRARSDSPEAMAKLAEQMKTPLPPPPGCELINEDERELWATYILARLPDDWRPFDLVTLFKVVKYEAEIRAQTRELDKEGYLVKVKGALKNNPRITLIGKLQNLQIVLIRALSINALPTGAGAIHNNAMAGQKVAKRAKEHVADGAELLSGR